MNIRIPGLEGIDIDEVLGRVPKRKAVDRKIKLSPKQKKKITAKPRKISAPMGEINIPGMGGITPRPRPTPKPPVNKVRPKPKPPLNKARPIDSPVISGGSPGGIGIGGTQLGERITGPGSFNKMFGKGESSKPDAPVEIPEIINIPGVGPIQLPNVQSGGVENPPNIFDDSEKTDPYKKRKFGNLYVPTDESVGRMTTSDGRVFSGTTVYDRYDPETDTYYGSQGGAMGMIPFSVKGSDMPKSFKDLFQESQKNVETQPETTPTEPTPTGSYESSYIDWLESKPEPPTVRPARRIGGGPAYRQAQQQYKEDLANWEGSKPSRDTFTAPAPSPVDTQPVDTQPVETQPIQAPPPPDPFKDYVPRNILGTSFDPKDVSYQKQQVADARARMTPGANIQGGGYLTYDNPLLGNKQTQFGGYGQPMPTAPLMNYAGLASPTTYSKPPPDPDKEIIR